MVQNFHNIVAPPFKLPGQLTPKGWMLPRATTFEQWKRIGIALGKVERSVYWLIGDWWAAGDAWDRKRVHLVRDDPTWEGPSYRVCQDCAWVAKAHELSRRRESLSFQHHREVAALKPIEADRLLDVAEAQALSTRQLRVAVRRSLNYYATQPGETSTVNDLDRLAASGRRFSTIYADPPWPYENQTTALATGNHYDTMSIEELCALPVASLAAPDAHLHLWVTSAFLVGPPERIFAAWGFVYSGSSFVLVKRRMGLGNYWRISHELLLTGVRGNAPRFRDNSLRSWLEVERTGQSVKPEGVRSLIERATPGPYLELFGRRNVKHWTVWGNEVRHVAAG